MRRKVERQKKKKLFSSSALNHCRLWNWGESCWSSEVQLTRMSTCMFDPAAMTHFCTGAQSRSDQKPQNKCCCFPLLPCGFGGGVSESWLPVVEVCARPERITANHSGSVGTPHRRDHALRITAPPVPWSYRTIHPQWKGARQRFCTFATESKVK